jgi:hypothetical protein
LPVNGLRRSGSFIVSVTTCPACSYSKKPAIKVSSVWFDLPVGGQA